MFFDIALYASLSIFLIGLIYKISTWFTRDLGILPEGCTPSTRILAAFKGVLGTLFSLKVFTILKVFILDVIIQRRILKKDILRWTMHMLIFYGFMILLLMHALDNYFAEPFFSEYFEVGGGG